MRAKSDISGEPVNLGRLFARARRRATGTMVLAVLLFAAAAAVIVHLKPRYQTEALLQVGEQATRMLDTATLMTPKAQDVEAVMSEVQVMQSADLLADVVRRLKLQDTDEMTGRDRSAAVLWAQHTLAWLQQQAGLAPPPVEDDTPDDMVAAATAELSQHVYVEAAGRSRVIRVFANSTDRNRAAAIANTLIDVYLQRLADAKEGSATKMLTVLRERITGLQKQVQEADQKSEAYRQKMQLFSSKSQNGTVDVSLASQQLQTLTASLAQATAVREQAEAKVRAAAASAGGGTMPEALSNRLVQDLHDQESTLAARQADLASKELPGNPAMKAIAAQLAQVRGKLGTESTHILQSFRNEAEVARAGERALAAQVAQVKVEIARYDEAAVPLRAAEQQADTSRKLLADLSRREHEIEALQGSQEPDAQRVSTARPPLLPYFPRTKALLFVALVGSLGSSIGLNLALEMRNKGMWSGDEVRDLLGVNCLGLVPLVSTRKRRSPADYVIQKPKSAFAEAIRTITVWLDVLHGTGNGRTVLLTSAVPGEGKTSLTMALGRQIAHAGERVVIVDLDFRRPSTYRIGRISNTPGVAGVLSGRATIDQALRKDVASPACLLPAGVTDNPGALLRGPALRELISNLRYRFDMVLLDSPPTSVVADTHVVAREADGVVFVAKWGSTPRDLVAAELRALEEAGAQVIGVTLNHVNAREHARYGYSDSGIYQGAARKYYLN
jgi:succinoglycan biosynthesis transport protein ExoP